LKINFLEKFIGSGFYTGYIKIASGTFASAAALLLYLIPGFENPVFLMAIIALFMIIGIDIGTKFESLYGKDPKECTVDELVGTWISLLFIPKKIWMLILAFLIWRALDIIKPYPFSKLEDIKGGWGIMLDDVALGFLALILNHVLINIIKNII
jgi:phosphatidylglycerophosphatase A